MHDITAGALFRLLEYRRKCGEVASALTENFTWMRSDTSFVFFQCRNYSGGSQSYIGCGYCYVAQFWKDYMERSRKALRTQPCGATVSALSILEPACDTDRECVQRMCQFCFR